MMNQRTQSGDSRESATTMEALAQLQGRSQEARRLFIRRQPKRISHVMADLVQRRGYAFEQTAAGWERAWQTAAGEKWRNVTKVGRFRRGTLEIRVANSLVLQELGFDKETLTDVLRSLMPDVVVEQIRFRIGL